MMATGRVAWVLAAVLAASPAARAVSLKECSLRYNAAKTAGTLNGADWKTFRAAQCGTAATTGATPVASTTASAAPATTAAAPAPAAPVATAKPSPGAGHAAAAAGPATFPTAVDPKYAKLSAGKGRMKTCLDQYHANKASGANGGLNWIAKGGYYSQCNAKLKGA